MAINGLKRNDFEIMAPVGSWESLYAAIQGGADAIYFGIEGLNMRARSAKIFDTNDMHQIVKVCNENGIKTYLTVNTIIYDDDMSLLHDIIDSAKSAGISAIIASDISAMQYAYNQGVEVHLSTQLNITNVEALKFYAQYADVVVLARELNLDQVEVIHNAIENEQIKGPMGELIRIEMFSHGALCMAVSGKCYLSLHELNSSANRGACNQVCRRSYIVHDKDSNIELEVENEYIMSPKDLKTIHFMNKMMDAGVRVFKIEGRARGPEYVRAVCECYNEAILAHLEGSYTDEKIKNWDARLAKVFNRGFWDGYYLGQRLGEWTNRYGSSATRVKTAVGKVMKYFSQISVAEFELSAGTINQGDELLVTGPTTGAVFFDADEIRLNDGLVVKIDEKGARFSIKVPEKVRPGDVLYLMRLVENKNISKYL